MAARAWGGMGWGGTGLPKQMGEWSRVMNGGRGQERKTQKVSAELREV